MLAYVHIEYSIYQFSGESNGGGGDGIPPLGPYGTERSVVLRGLKEKDKFTLIYPGLWDSPCSFLKCFNRKVVKKEAPGTP